MWQKRGSLGQTSCRDPEASLPLTVEDPTFPMLLTRQTVRQSFDLCSHRSQALRTPGIHATHPGLLEDSLSLGLLGRDHGSLRTSITTTSKPELQEKSEGSLGKEHGTHSDPSMRWVSCSLCKQRLPIPEPACTCVPQQSQLFL